MKANELRIGNLYDQFGNITEVNWCTIKDLEKAPKEQLWCKPIPLTEELLLKFGFEKDGNKIYRNGRFFIENLFGNRMTFRITINNAESAHANSIEFVHQLQNLYFALCGEELEMK